ncbi:hypothetical protein NP493_459g01049 [Ridgeia piscesae]|uniref:CAP-Gly domain-containing protein n=1 Tax=Ridgeia piscesae TaxID=27915 RepID=A0AAD9KZD6_RIDPI|nr:hypothetical protein NP493_459g01049 [Ridgeia piscesae]
MDPFLCGCSACQKFWTSTFGSGFDQLLKPATDRVRDTSEIFSMVDVKGGNHSLLKVGDMVRIPSGHKGTVKFIGILDSERIAPETYVGVHLYDEVSFADNGIVKGKKYFNCPPGHGVIVKYAATERLPGQCRRPPYTGNSMFPSYKEIQRNRSRIRRKQAAHAHDAWTGAREPVVHVFDRDDIAYKDGQKRAASRRHQMAIGVEQQNMWRRREMQRGFERLKQKFGTGERAERLARTLQTLQEAYDIGASGRWQATDETGTLESREEDTEDPPSSKGNSREGGRGVLFREM